jgi:hypothetical protein
MNWLNDGAALLGRLFLSSTSASCAAACTNHPVRTNRKPLTHAEHCRHWRAKALQARVRAVVAFKTSSTCRCRQNASQKCANH